MAVDFTAEELLFLLYKLLSEYNPKIEQEAFDKASDQSEMFKKLSSAIKDLRDVTSAMSKGQLDTEIPRGGYVISNLKALQANLNHLEWQLVQVSKGDLSQRIDFLGEFSEAFNLMCAQLETHKSALKELAQFDVLTGIANRRYLDEYLNDLFERNQRDKAGFSLMMMDIDFFKKVNDTYGHDVGDVVLQHTAQYLQKIFRTSDFTARYGGEEFMAVLPGASKEVACKIAERVRSYVEENPIVVSDELKIPITVSIGVSEWEEVDESWEPTVKRSDNALYEAKNSGRNKVVAL